MDLTLSTTVDAFLAGTPNSAQQDTLATSLGATNNAIGNEGKILKTNITGDVEVNTLTAAVLRSQDLTGLLGAPATLTSGATLGANLDMAGFSVTGATNLGAESITNSIASGPPQLPFGAFFGSDLEMGTYNITGAGSISGANAGAVGFPTGINLGADLNAGTFSISNVSQIQASTLAGTDANIDNYANGTNNGAANFPYGIKSTLAVPATAASAGVAGTTTWDDSYIYVCTATDTWKRVAIATW